MQKWANDITDKAAQCTLQLSVPSSSVYPPAQWRVQAVLWEFKTDKAQGRALAMTGQHEEIKLDLAS